jgi:hypothetical protein
MLKSFISIFVLGLLFVFANHNLLSVKEKPALFFMIDKPQGGSLTLFLDTGNGFNQKESLTRKLGKYEKQLIKFELPDSVKALRIDPDVNTQSFKIAWLRVGYFRWPFATTPHFEQMVPANQIKTIEPHAKNGWEIHFAPPQNDPYLFLKIDNEGWSVIKSTRSKIKGLLFGFEGILLGLLAGFSIFQALSKKKAA